MDPFGSVVCASGYEPINGSLFRESVTDYALPLEPKRWRMNEFRIMRNFQFAPGRGGDSHDRQR